MDRRRGEHTIATTGLEVKKATIPRKGNMMSCKKRGERRDER